MSDREPYVPVHHNTYQVPDDARLRTFVGGCHQCAFASHGSMGSVQTDRREHEEQAAAAVAHYFHKGETCHCNV